MSDEQNKPADKKPSEAPKPSDAVATPSDPVVSLIWQLMVKSPIHAVIVVLLLANLGVPIGSMLKVGGQVEDANKAIVKQLEEQNKALTKQFDEFKTSVSRSMDEIKLSLSEMRQKVEAQEKLNLAEKIQTLKEDAYKRGVDAAALQEQLKVMLARSAANEERIRALESKQQK